MVVPPHENELDASGLALDDGDGVGAAGVAVGNGVALGASVGVEVGASVGGVLGDGVALAIVTGVAVASGVADAAGVAVAATIGEAVGGGEADGRAVPAPTGPIGEPFEPEQAESKQTNVAHT